MAGKPPKVKPVSAPTKTPDVNADGSFRPPFASPAMPHLSTAHRLEVLQPSYKTDPVAVAPAISVNPTSSAIDEFALLAAKSPLTDYWVPTPKSLGAADAQGMRILKQRQYVAVADDHIVQVVLDAESGLLRATLARERNPSGPLLKRDGEGRFWVALDNDGVTFPDSITAQTAELFRRTGRSVAQFSDTTVVRLLAVSGVNEEVLRAVIAHDRPVPFLLEDTLRRFELDQQVQAEGRGASESFTRFKEVEDAFESDCDENTLRMRRVFPDLPKTAAQAIWRNTSAAERLHMHNQPGIPKRVAVATLVALREVRLARALEGIYLEAVANPDSDRLLLHMIGNLVDWPQQIRIEIRQGAIDGDVFAAIGDAQSSDRHLLIRQHDAYMVASGGPPSLLGAQNLYTTLWSLLLPVHRKALGISDSTGQALQQLLRTQPPPSRQVVSEVLRLAPLPAAVKAGTTQNRQEGLLRGGADVIPESTKSFESRIRDLYPEISDEDVAAFIDKRLQHDPSGVLSRLENEFPTLRHELEVWRVEVPPHPTEGVVWSAEAFAEQSRLRQRFSEKLLLVWQQKMLSVEDAAGESFSSFIDFNAELPRISTRLEHVTELVLEARNPGVKLGRFLESFPNLSYLVLEKVRMDGFAPGIFQMRDLRHLILRDCSLRLSENEAEGLSRIETLTLLRLDGNPLGVAPHLGFMRQMKELYLANTGLTGIPSGVEQLSRLKILDLRDNNIVDIGDDFFDIPDTQDTYVDLRGNPLSQAALLRINEYLQNASMDSEIVIRIQDQVFDEAFELSEFSDSGVGSDSDEG
ncbi:leucine-rich repeat domain-containing protein [Pseudomonas granadensis]|uniref:leucine-rich repeat domain-containing protein n=1 Tax=Pseudomonas granadensis TaxID=1421430 RepID=UPI00087B9581|nr:leucine-rich repeat domain-containing protein [Pseudomonas granadensis]SDS18968.1 hypothetical protein SAMN05216579_0208 [Pseudomonas granadensis]